MGKSPAFQFYAQDFDMDTASWTCPQVGVYIRLLMSEWVNGALPNNMAELSRIARIDIRTLAKMWKQTLAKKFTLNDANMYVNNRLELEREKQAIHREIQSKKGSTGANKRWEGHIAQALHRHKPNDSSSSSSSSSIHIKNKRYIYTLPTLDEVKNYCKERNNTIDPEGWFDYYTANGFMVGKNKMKDWKATVRNWERKQHIQPQVGHAKEKWERIADGEIV